MSENERSSLELEEEPFHSLTDLLKHVHVGQLCRVQQVAADQAADLSEMKVKGSGVTPSWTVWSFNYEQDVLSSRLLATVLIVTICQRQQRIVGTQKETHSALSVCAEQKRILRL